MAEPFLKVYILLDNFYAAGMSMLAFAYLRILQKDSLLSSKDYSVL